MLKNKSLDFAKISRNLEISKIVGCVEFHQILFRISVFLSRSVVPCGLTVRVSQNIKIYVKDKAAFLSNLTQNSKLEFTNSFDSDYNIDNKCRDKQCYGLQLQLS